MLFLIYGKWDASWSSIFLYLKTHLQNAFGPSQTYIMSLFMFNDHTSLNLPIQEYVYNNLVLPRFCTWQDINMILFVPSQRNCFISFPTRFCTWQDTRMSLMISHTDRFPMERDISMLVFSWKLYVGISKALKKRRSYKKWSSWQELMRLICCFC